MRYKMVLALFLLSSSYAQIQRVVNDNQGEGKIDWGNRTLIATGIGSPNPGLPETAQKTAAIRAAQQVAVRNAIEATKGIFLNSSSTVRNFMVENEKLSSDLSGFISQFERESQAKTMNDGSVEVTIRIPLDGTDGLGKLLLGNAIAENAAVTSFDGRKADKEFLFSGLVVDCRGAGAKPSLSPRMLDESGKEVYGTAYVARAWAMKHGIAAYTKDYQHASKMPRVGPNPAQMKATKVHGENGTDVVISNASAAAIRSASQNLKVLSECRVVFVID